MQIIHEAVKVAYVIETKESITCQKFGSCNFWGIANSVLSKGNLLYLLYLKAVSATVLLVYILSLRVRVLVNPGKMFFCFTSEALLANEKIKF